MSLCRFDSVFSDRTGSLPGNHLFVAIRIPAMLEEVSHLSEMMRGAAGCTCEDVEFVNAIELVIGELCNNIVIHGYGEQSGGGSILVELIQQVDSVCLIVTDYASRFDPTAKMREGVVEVDMDSVTETSLGMGLQIVANLVDFFEYRPRKIGNQLLLCKYYPSKGACKTEI